MTKSWWHGRAILAQGCPATSNMMYFLSTPIPPILRLEVDEADPKGPG